MVPQAFVRQFAAGQKIDLDVADQEVILYYALALLNEIGLVGYPPGGTAPGPLLFKGGTALRKCLFGSTGRFSQDIDLDATHRNGFEEQVEAGCRSLIASTRSSSPSTSRSRSSPTSRKRLKSAVSRDSSVSTLTR
jgi:hypothetical protein